MDLSTFLHVSRIELNDYGDCYILDPLSQIAAGEAEKEQDQNTWGSVSEQVCSTALNC